MALEECLSREGGRHCFILSSEIKKDQKNFRSKLVDDCPKLSNGPNETQKQTKWIEIHQSQTITFRPRSRDIGFPGGPLR